MLTTIARWVRSFFDINGDQHITFPDVSMLVVGVVFTLKMLGHLSAQSPSDPILWGVFAAVIGGYASAAKFLELKKA